MHVEMGIEALIPGVQNHDGAELAMQTAFAKVKQRLTGTLKEQAE